MNKNGCDLVKWDTGCLGFVGYDDNGVSRGVEVIPFNIDENQMTLKNEPKKVR